MINRYFLMLATDDISPVEDEQLITAGNVTLKFYKGSGPIKPMLINDEHILFIPENDGQFMNDDKTIGIERLDNTINLLTGDGND